MRKLNLNALIALLVIAIVVLGCGRLRKTSSSSNQPASSSQAAPGDIAAEDLFAEYQQDKDAADAKYKGKIITVSGTVDTSKTQGNSSYVTLKTSNLILRVQCIFKSSESDAISGLTKGQSVRVRGKVFGRIGNVVLQDCELL